MSRIIRKLGLAMLLTALLVVSTAGTVFAAERNGDENAPDYAITDRLRDGSCQD